jgi:predicted RNA-binding protein Jag
MERLMNIPEDQLQYLKSVAADLNIAREAQQYVDRVKQADDIARVVGRDNMRALGAQFDATDAVRGLIGKPGSALDALKGAFATTSSHTQLGSLAAQFNVADAVRGLIGKPGSALDALKGAFATTSSHTQLGALTAQVNAIGAARSMIGQRGSALDALKKAFDTTSSHTQLGALTAQLNAADAVRSFIGEPGSALESMRRAFATSSNHTQLGSLAAQLNAADAARTLFGGGATHLDNSHVQRLFASMSNLVHAHAKYGLSQDQIDDLGIDSAEPNTILAATSSEAAEQHADGLVALIEIVVRTVLASTNSQDKQIFWTRVFPVIMTAVALLLTPVFDHYIKQALAAQSNPAQQTDPKQIKVAVRKLGLPLLLLSGHRYVDVKISLPVRLSARINAKEIGTLPRASVVQIIQSDRRGALIRWTDEKQDVILQGWVLSRYLKKFQ